jgi:hypothetical protein
VGGASRANGARGEDGDIRERGSGGELGELGEVDGVEDEPAGESAGDAPGELGSGMRMAPSLEPADGYVSQAIRK